MIIFVSSILPKYPTLMQSHQQSMHCILQGGHSPNLLQVGELVLPCPAVSIPCPAGPTGASLSGSGKAQEEEDSSCTTATTIPFSVLICTPPFPVSMTFCPPPPHLAHHHWTYLPKFAAEFAGVLLKWLLAPQPHSAVVNPSTC